MLIFKTHLIISDGGPEYAGHTFLMDTIKHENKLWLVPEWQASQKKGFALPTRIICMDSLKYSEAAFPPYHYQLSRPISMSVLNGKVKDGYEIVEKPNILVPGPVH